MDDLKAVTQKLRVGPGDLVQDGSAVRTAHQGDGATGRDLANAHAVAAGDKVYTFGGADDVHVDRRNEAQIGDHAGLIDPDVRDICQDIDQLVYVLDDEGARSAALDLGVGQGVADDIGERREGGSVGGADLAAREVDTAVALEADRARAGIDANHFDAVLCVSCGGGKQVNT